MDWIQPLFSALGVFGGLGVIVLGYIGITLLSRHSAALEAELKTLEDIRKAVGVMEAKYLDDADRALQIKRLKVYPELWELTQTLPKWPRDTVTNGTLAKFSQDMQNWYFQTGGLYMSDRTQRAYRHVQEAMEDIGPQDRNELDDISGEEYETVRKRCSTMRTQMTLDLGTRRALPEHISDDEAPGERGSA